MRSLIQAEKEDQMISPKDLSWEAIRARTSHWVTDFEFFEFEIVFLQHLIARAKTCMTKHENDALMEDLVRKLDSLELRRNLFVRILKFHRRQTESIIENPFVHDGHAIKEDHEDLEKRIIEFMQDFRSKKCRVYLLVESAVGREKIRHLFDSNVERNLIEYE